jgi:hypothetical protein
MTLYCGIDLHSNNCVVAGQLAHTGALYAAIWDARIKQFYQRKKASYS